MATAKPKAPKDSMAKEEALLASAKYGGNKQTGGMNNILQKRLNKGQKYFDSGDYNMAKAKTPVPKGVQPDTPADAAPAEPQQVEQAQPTIEEHPQTAPADEVKDAGSSKLAEADNATKLSAEPTAKASSDEPQRGYPRKVIPTASPLAKPTALTAQADSTATSTFTITTTTTSAVGAGAGGPIPQPRALAAHLTHATHSGPFVTHPERPSPSAESPPPDGDTEAGPHADCPECCN